MLTSLNQSDPVPVAADGGPGVRAHHGGPVVRRGQHVPKSLGDRLPAPRARSERVEPTRVWRPDKSVSYVRKGIHCFSIFGKRLTGMANRIHALMRHRELYIAARKLGKIIQITQIM